MALEQKEVDNLIIYKTEDGTLLLEPSNFQKYIEQESRKTKQNPLERFLILMIGVSGKPVQGRIMLVKEVFMFVKNKIEILNERPNLEFFPHHYGPYSREIGVEIKSMQKRGIVEVSEQGVNLTSFGRKILNDIKADYDTETWNEIKEFRIGLDELGPDGIMRYVYQNYEEYTLNSKVKRRYLQNKEENQ